MTKAELNKYLTLNDNTQIILSVWIDLHIDGEWDEEFNAVTDIKTFKEIIDKLKEGNSFGMYRCNCGDEIEYDEFIDHASIQVITQAEADVLNKYNAFTSLNIDEFFELCDY